jgi:carbonic anhydrase
MDHAAYESLQDWQKTHTAQGGTVELTGRRVGTGAHIDAPVGAGKSAPAAARTTHAPPTAENPLADCRCRPWTPWRNHQCEVPRPTPRGNGGPAGTSAAGARPMNPATGPGDLTGPGDPTGPGGSGAPGLGDPRGLADSGDSGDPGGPGLPGSTGPVAMERGHQLVRGISAFQRNTAPLVRGELARLAREGQQPTQVFLTCADSRVVTSMITSSGPGDLFVVRNVGNLVPPPGEESGDDSVGAAIEYAVDVLRVRSITVCGHSGCGAMQALLSSEPGADRTPLKRWLRHGLPSLDRMADDTRPAARLAGRAPADAVEQLCLTNVVQQLDHLRAHESVARALRAGALELHGLYFHVGEAQTYLLTERDGGELFDHVGVAGLTA